MSQRPPFRLAALFGFVASLLFASPLLADAKPSGPPPSYPLKTCVVSGDALDDMGHPVDYLYPQPGQPDRLVRFCCKDCIKDFNKEPAKYLLKLDEAAAAARAKAAAKSAAQKS